MTSSPDLIPAWGGIHIDFALVMEAFHRQMNEQGYDLEAAFRFILENLPVWTVNLYSEDFE